MRCAAQPLECFTSHILVRVCKLLITVLYAYAPLANDGDALEAPKSSLPPHNMTNRWPLDLSLFGL